ncbi:hypothetical protein HDE_10731 [Halotydeus destructor]|nr:hypothetical protein HDE_10731 [Halotydeus destructor]
MIWFETPIKHKSAIFHPEDMTIDQLLYVFRKRNISANMEEINHSNLVLLYLDSVMPHDRRIYKSNRSGTFFLKLQAECNQRLGECDQLTGLPSASRNKRLNDSTDGQKASKVIKLIRNNNAEKLCQDKESLPAVPDKPRQRITWP